MLFTSVFFKLELSMWPVRFFIFFFAFLVLVRFGVCVARTFTQSNTVKAKVEDHVHDVLCQWFDSLTAATVCHYHTHKRPYENLLCTFLSCCICTFFRLTSIIKLNTDTHTHTQFGPNIHLSEGIISRSTIIYHWQKLLMMINSTN